MKKAISVALVFLFVIGCLAGCGQASKTPASSQAATAPAASASPASESAAKEIKWPQKTIQITVGYAAGGDSDLYARLCAKYLEKKLGTTAVVVNTTGASGVTGAISVLDSPADGYSVLFNHYGCLVNEATGTAGISFVEDFSQACTVLIDNSYTLVARKALGLKNFEDLCKYAKANPETLTIVASANTNGYDIVSQVENAAGIRLKKVEGSGSASERIAAVLGGQQDLIYANYNLLKDYVANGDFIVMGSIGQERSAAFPDVPSLTELGASVVSPYIFSFRFPKETDQAIVDKFDATMKEICADSEFIEEAKKLGGNIYFTSGAESYKTQVASLAATKQRLGA